MRELTPDELAYRPLSSLAVIALWCAPAACAAALWPQWQLLACGVLTLAIFSLWHANRYLLVGKRYAFWSAGIAAAVLGPGSYWQLQQWRSETLPGYQRMSFSDLFAAQTQEVSTPETNLVAEMHVEKKLCLKGYCSSWGHGESTDVFLLTSRPIAFGARSIQSLAVRLKHPVLVDSLERNPVAVSGTLRKSEGDAADIGFILDEAIIRPVHFHWGLELPRNEGC